MINPIRLSLIFCAVVACFSFTGIDNKYREVTQPRHTVRPFKTGNTSTAASTFKLVIKKSDYEMVVYDADGWYGTYPVVFGNKKQDDKRMEGDRLTPEGSFKIVGKKIHKQWGKFLMLDYPTQESYERFKSRKASGEIPQKATIGGGIGIHGTRPNEEWVIDKYINWTSGCIAVRYSDMDELYDMLPIGTEVVIEK